MRDVAVIGAGMVKFGKYLGTSMKVIARDAVNAALASAGVDQNKIQAAVVGNASMKNFITQTQVFQLWSALSQTSSWTLGRTIPSSQSAAIPQGQTSGIYADDSSGFSTYNAL